MPSSLPTRSLSPWISPGKNTVVGCHSLLQEHLFKTTVIYLIIDFLQYLSFKKKIQFNLQAKICTYAVMTRLSLLVFYNQHLF